MRKIVNVLIDKAKYLDNVTISDTKHKLTNVDDTLMLFSINETLGMAKISQYVDIINNHTLDLSKYPLLNCIPSKFFIRIFFIILWKLRILYIDDSIGEPILMLDESKGLVTYNDIIHKLPFLVLDDGSPAGYSALSSLDEVCLFIDMKINGPLQQLLNSDYGKSIIQDIKLQKSKTNLSDIRKMIILLEELSSSELLSSVKLIPYNYQPLLKIDDSSVLNNFIIDYEKETYQINHIEPDWTCFGVFCV